MSSPVRAKVRRFIKGCAITIVATIVLIAAAAFPYDVDKPLSAEDLDQSRKYYAQAYKKNTPNEEQHSDYETKYVQIGIEHAEGEHILERVSEFAAEYGLRTGAVLDVGSGRGYLQDVVDNYTGL